MRFLRSLPILAATLAASSLSLRAAPPAAPTALSVVTLGVNTFRLTWTDNSTDESFFGVQIKHATLTGGNWVSLDSVTNTGTGAITFHQIINLEPTSTAFTFRVLAVKNGTPQETSSTAEVVAAATPATSTFLAPSGLVASASDGTITLSWADNANSEWGYRIENREGTSGSFVDLGSTNPNQNSNLAITGHNPATTYQYRVRAFKGSGTNTTYTAYSNTVTVPTLAFAAPTNLSATRTNERDIAFAQIDNSTAESGYFIEYRVAGTTDWAFLGSTGPNISTIAAVTDLFDPATAYEFRTQAFIGASTNPVSVSAFSNIAAANTVFNVPAAVTATPNANTAVTVSWTDTSAVEQGFAVYYRPAGNTNFTFFAFTAANATSHTVTGLNGASAYEFQVKSAYEANAPTNRSEIVYSAASAVAAATTRDEMNSPVYAEGVVNRPFTYTVSSTGLSSLTAGSITNLPAGLHFDFATRAITGVPTTAGLTQCPVSLTHADGWTHNTTLTIRILAPPAASGSSTPVSLVPGQNTSVSLTGRFTDSDSESAVAVATNLGTMHILLYNGQTPLTVSNFMAYATAGDFAGTSFHRSVPGFVVQGGAFRPDPGTGPAAFTSVTTRPPVTNEPGLSSVRGTVAMAKLGGNPDSATNQFFVNLRNNGPILDNQNGGFTVFGRVVLADMVVADNMAALPRGDYQISLNGNPVPFEDWPLTSASAAMDNSKAVVISSVVPVPVLSYAVVSNSHPSVVGALINGTSLELQPLAGGSATLVVRATDLDGNSADSTVSVTVPDFYSTWITTQGVPVGQSAAGDDPDHDGYDNFLEFAFLGSPATPEPTGLYPLVRVNDPAAPPSPNLTAEFNLRKNAHLVYRVLVNSNLVSGAWIPVWDSALDSTNAPAVVSIADQGTHYRVRVRDTTVAPPGTSRFITVEPVQP